MNTILRDRFITLIGFPDSGAYYSPGANTAFTLALKHTVVAVEEKAIYTL
ncbi:hypothetical protein Daudx_0146 [Candidatus Desulforudis audaxviator]|nr:hypothetical protein Daudx_0146 [Candidatus Desulforudis audaxviator]